MTLRALLLTAGLAVAVAACGPIYEEPAYPAYDASYGYAEPSIVYSSWGEPMYVYGDAYWVWRNNGWMTWGPTGWYWASPPIYLSSWHRHYWYGGYGAPGYRGPRYPYNRGTAIRDHRTTRSAPRAYGNGNSSGGVRPSSSWSAPSRTWRAPSTSPSRGGSSGGTIRDHRRR